jgi:hypothetical protein
VKSEQAVAVPAGPLVVARAVEASDLLDMAKVREWIDKELSLQATHELDAWYAEVERANGPARVQIQSHPEVRDALLRGIKEKLSDDEAVAPWANFMWHYRHSWAPAAFVRRLIGFLAYEVLAERVHLKYAVDGLAA